MSSLEELVDQSRTDKGSNGHSYLGLYETLLCKKKETATHILEVGVCSGGSIKLWRDYFVNATIYGLELRDEAFWDAFYKKTNGWSDIKNDNRIQLLANVDAYDQVFFNKLLDSGLKFDMVLDDGPHTLHSMKKFIVLYSQLLKEDGILMIEDIQHSKWCTILSSWVPLDLQPYIKIHDLRHIKNQYDSIVFVIDKSAS